MKKPAMLFAATVSIATLGACTSPAGPNEQAGTVIGAVVGGVLGSQVGHGSGRTAATIAGTIVGGMIGGNIGRSMDDTDRMRTAQVLERGRTNEPTSWRNPDTGASYTVTPVRTYQTAAAEPCREYTVDAMIGGRPEKVVGHACRQADGSWRNVE